MPVTQNITFSATPPTTGENPTTFNYNAISCWDDLKNNIVPALNTAFGQLNDLETNVNAKEVSCVNSALSAASDSLLAAGAANNKGAWSLLTGALNIPAAVNHSGSIWILNRNIANVALSEPTPTNTDWTESSGITQQELDAVSSELDDLSAASVKTTTDQNIAGIKTFSSPIKLSNSGFTATLQSDTLGSDVVHTLPTTTSNLAPLESPFFVGEPTAPTAPAGTNTTQIATTAFVDTAIPNKLNASGLAPMYACRAWVNFNGTGTVAIRASGNVSSITDNGVGDYTVNFTTAMPDVNYSFSFSGTRSTLDSNDIIQHLKSISTSSIGFYNTTASSASMDGLYMTCQIFR